MVITFHFLNKVILGILFHSGCPSLPDIPNGSVAVSGFGTGDMAVYSCDEGYELDGDSTRECSFDSSWSGEASVCRSLAGKIIILPELSVSHG